MARTRLRGAAEPFYSADLRRRPLADNNRKAKNLLRDAGIHVGSSDAAFLTAPGDSQANRNGGRRSCLPSHPTPLECDRVGMTTRSGLSRPPSLGIITAPIGTRSTCGIQVRSTYRSNPAFGFGTASRDTAQKRFISDEHKSKELPKFNPGPGAYNHRVTTGKQPVSQQKTEPKFSFGTAPRFQKHEEKRTAAIPGPGAYLI